MTVRTRLVIVILASFICMPAHGALLATANVMAPLDLDAAPPGAWDAFSAQLKIAKSMGIDAVSVDVWWGKVERTGDNVFDWSYYDRIVAAVEAAGLHWVPIMSFHQCGGNVGDSCNIPIPVWIWDRFKDQGVSREALQYRSERDNVSSEVVAVWQDKLVVPQYQEFMNAFQSHFSAKAAITDEINLSMGPAGELRYPSYNAHDGAACGFPTRGCFQAYSGSAQAEFRAYVLNKYHDLAGVNAAWKDSLGNTPLTDVAQIGPPDDQDPANGRAAAFISRDDEFRTQYGRDFIDWYNQSLVDHGHRLLDAAIATFSGGAFKNTPISLKMAGVHWQMMDSADHPRVAEIAAGLIQTSIGSLKDEAHGFGYQNILNMIASYRGRAKIDFHFTCLEKDDMEWDGSNHAFSLAKTLVFWVAQGAADKGLVIKGENALDGGVMSDHGWDNIWNAFHWAAYTGLTVLRINAVTTDSDVGQRRYRDFIAVCKVNCSPPPH
jgi:hypothetical protein